MGIEIMGSRDGPPAGARSRRKLWSLCSVAVLGGVAALAASSASAASICDGKRTVTATIVAHDQPTVFNRLGAQNPNWMMYSLERDLVNKTTGVPCTAAGAACGAGNVVLRPDKRTRTMALRVAEGDCLTVTFKNYLAPVANPNNPIQDNLINDDQVAERTASFHPQGLERVGSMASDGGFVGKNATSLVDPGGRRASTSTTPRTRAPSRCRTWARPWVRDQQRRHFLHRPARHGLGGNQGREDLSRPGDRGGDAACHHRHHRRPPAATRSSTTRRPTRPPTQPLDRRGQGRAADPQHDHAARARSCTRRSTRSSPAPMPTALSRPAPIRWRAWASATRSIRTGSSPIAPSPRSSTTSRPTPRPGRAGISTRCCSTPWRACATAS